MTKPLRFMANNFINPDTCEITGTPSLTGFPLTNVYSEKRGKVWRPAGNFTITNANRKIYINDGSAKDGTLTTGNYTFATLAAHIQSVLNAISTNWTCAYDLAGETYKFTINRTSGTAELELSEDTDAVWDTIGFLTGTDLTSAPFEADEPRNHTHERIVIDCLAPVKPTFAGLIGTIGQPFIPGSNAVIKFMANGVNSWDAPDFEATLSRSDYGAMAFLDDVLTTEYRFLAIDLRDRMNPCGPQGFEIAYAYIGDHLTVDGTGHAPGYSMKWDDLSVEMRAETGAQYFVERPRFRVFSGLNANLIEAPDRRELQRFARLKGITGPFFLSLDPGLALSDDIGEYTFLARFTSAPDFQHVIRDYYDMRFEAAEVI